jgi:hypothetical protein
VYVESAWAAEDSDPVPVDDVDDLPVAVDEDVLLVAVDDDVLPVVGLPVWPVVVFVTVIIHEIHILFEEGSQ